MNKLTLICTVTGKAVTYRGTEYIADRIQKSGSLENLQKNFVCKSAKWSISRENKSASTKIPTVVEPTNRIKVDKAAFMAKLRKAVKKKQEDFVAVIEAGDREIASEFNEKVRYNADKFIVGDEE